MYKANFSAERSASYFSCCQCYPAPHHNTVNNTPSITLSSQRIMLSWCWAGVGQRCPVSPNRVATKNIQPSFPSFWFQSFILCLPLEGCNLETRLAAGTQNLLCITWYPESEKQDLHLDKIIAELLLTPLGREKGETQRGFSGCGSHMKESKILPTESLFAEIRRYFTTWIHQGFNIFHWF